MLDFSTNCSDLCQYHCKLCVHHELAVQVWAVTTVKPPFPSRVIWVAFWWRGEFLSMGANWKAANIQWSDTSVNHTVNSTVSSYRQIVTALLRGLPITERVKKKREEKELRLPLSRKSSLRFYSKLSEFLSGWGGTGQVFLRIENTTKSFSAPPLT